MTKCNYHALQDTYTMLEEQLSAMSEKIADLKLNLEVSELDIDLDNLEAQLLSIAEKIEGLNLKIDIENIDIDLDNLETQLIAISEKMDALSLNVVIDSIDRSILLNIETRLSDINSQIDNLGVNVVGEISYTSNKISELTNQLKIANQIALLKELDSVSTELKQSQYASLKDLLFTDEDIINSESEDNSSNGTSDPSVSPHDDDGKDEPSNPIIDGGST